MKDLIITKKRQKQELLALLACFVLANILNIIAIVTYHAPAWEVLTSIIYVICFTIFLYVVWIVLRIILYGIKRTFKKNQ